MKRKDVKERNDYIVELIKVTKEGVEGKTIDKDCNITCKNRAKIMAKLMEDHPEIKRGGTQREPVYFWIPGEERETHSPFLLNRKRREAENKNKEGYTDMTAFQAIKNVEKTDPTALPNPGVGEVWSCNENDRSVSYIYVLAVFKDGVDCITLEEIPQDDFIDYQVDVEVMGVRRTGSIKRLRYKPLKYLKNRVKFKESSVLSCAMNKIVDAFHLKAYLKPSESEVKVETKIVEKPVIPEGYMTKEEARMACLRVEATIWQDVANKLLVKG